MEEEEGMRGGGETFFLAILKSWRIINAVMAHVLVPSKEEVISERSVIKHTAGVCPVPLMAAQTSNTALEKLKNHTQAFERQPLCQALWILPSSLCVMLLPSGKTSLHST